MATKYAAEQTGVLDGTLNPPDKANGGRVNAQTTVLLATKVAGESWDSGDTIVLGKKLKGQAIVGISVFTDATLGSATIAVGIAGSTAKYAAASTATAVNVPNNIGPKAIPLADAAADEEELIATIAAANIAAGRTVVIKIELASV